MIINPTVSVVIATYRQDETLKRAISSVLNQNYEETEIIVVDDNADFSWNMRVENIIKEFPQIIYIQNKSNQGSAKTRNIGINESSGDYITFLDDDDVYLPNKIFEQVNFMREKALDVSVTDLNLYNEQNKLIDRRRRNYIKSNEPKELLKYHFMYHITGTDTMMFNRNYLKEIGGFDEIDLGDEFYLMKKAIQNGGKFGYLPECDVKAYVHIGENGLSSGQSKIECENKLFEFKSKEFEKLDKSTVNYIKMRHHAVLAFACLRMKRYGRFFVHSFKSFLWSPMQCLKLFVRRPAMKSQ